MRRTIWTTMAAAVLLAGTAAAAPYSPTGAGTSTVGGLGADYATLGAAMSAISTAGTRDNTQWVVEITGDTTEASNIFLTCNITSGGQILIRPAAATTPTVTFTATVDNAGPSGHFIIGSTLAAGYVLQPTNGVVIDGSNNGGTSRDLTIRNTSANAHTFSSLIGIVGDTDGTVIKNCKILNLGTGGASCSAVSVRPRNQTAANFIPDNWEIRNNLLVAGNSSQGHGVNVANAGTLIAGGAPSGFTIADNDIYARIRGIFFSPAGSGTVDNNRITSGFGGATNGISTFGIFNNTTNSFNATQNITNNHIEVRTDNVTGTQGASGMFLGTYGAGSTVNVRNNAVIVRSTAATFDRPVIVRGIHVTSGVTYNVQHNTIDLSAAATPAAGVVSPAYVYGIGGFLGAANITIQNNLVMNRVPGGEIYYRPNNPTGTFALDENLIYTASGDIATNSRLLTTGNNRASTGTTRTITTSAAHSLVVGDTIIVALNSVAATASQYEGTYVIDSVPTTTTFTYTGPTSLTEAGAAVTSNIAVVSPTGSITTWANLAAWQGSTSTPDLNSDTTDPTGSISPVDLHLINTAASDLVAAAQVGGITTDMDAEARAAAPFRGADEFAANSVPTDITIDQTATVAENQTVSVVGYLTSVDSNPNDWGTFSILTNPGSAFAITHPNVLAVTTALDFETIGATANVEVQVTDRAGATTTKIIPITLTNVNEAPTDIALSNDTIAENNTPPSTVGSLSTTDPDAGDTFTYTLVTGTGDTDNASFIISGSNLQLNVAADFETKSTYNVRVRSTDAGSLFFEEAFVVNISDVVESAVSDWTTLHE